MMFELNKGTSSSHYLGGRTAPLYETVLMALSHVRKRPTYCTNYTRSDTLHFEEVCEECEELEYSHWNVSLEYFSVLTGSECRLFFFLFRHVRAFISSGSARCLLLSTSWGSSRRPRLCLSMLVKKSFMDLWLNLRCLMSPWINLGNHAGLKRS